MKVLVTGGAGFIGSHTVDALLERGHDVRILDILQKPVHLKGKPDWVPSEAEFVEGDVRDKSQWERCLEGVSAVYHLAAYQDYLPDFSTFFHVNAVSTALMYEVIEEQGLDIEKVVIASSQFVQGEGLYQCGESGVQTGVELRPESQLAAGNWEHRCPECDSELKYVWTPESYTAPPNAYAMAKQSQEIQGMTFGRRYDIPTVALRYSIVQGPRQSFYNAYSGACRIFSLNYYFDKAPTLYEDGMQCRDFVNIHDVVRANMLALEDERANFQVFNVGGGQAYTIVEFADIVRSVVADRKDHDLPSAEIPGLYRYGDTRNACSDISKLRGLGWEPQSTPRKSVEDYVTWLYEQDNVEDILDYATKAMKNLNVVRSVEN
ncbi:MAG: NAD-dependent epimerase/dehydratase family protein [Pseudomonadota bacterium]